MRNNFLLYNKFMKSGDTVPNPKIKTMTQDKTLAKSQSSLIETSSRTNRLFSEIHHTNIVRNGSPWSNIVFIQEVISHSNMKDQAWKHTMQYYPQRLFFSLFSLNFDDHLSKHFTGLLFHAYVGIHQVIILVFCIYQRCAVVGFIKRED